MSLQRLGPLLVLGLAMNLILGCGGGESSRLVARLPLDDAAELVPGDSGATIDHDVTHDGGGAFRFYSRGIHKVAVVEFPITKLRADSLKVTLMARTEALERPFTIELILYDSEGDGRFLTYEVLRMHRTLDWYPVTFGFQLGEKEQPVRGRLSVIVPAGVVWIDDIAVWDGEASEMSLE